MRKPKYLLIVILCLLALNKAEALDINYSTILDSNTSNILIQYNSIGEKNNYICNIKSLACIKSKKNTLGKKSVTTISQSLKNELTLKNANHITISPSKNFIAYYIKGKDSSPTRTFNIRNIKTGKEYNLSNSVSYWDLVSEQGRVFAFSPNSKEIIYVDDSEGAMALYLVDTTKLADEKIAGLKLTTSAFQIDDFIFTDNQTLYYIGNSKDNPYVWSLYQYNIKTGKDKIIDTMVSYTDSLLKVGSSIIYNHLQENGYSPKMYNTISKQIKQFKTPYTKTNKNIKNQEVINSKNLHGVLMKPTLSNTSISHPLVIWLHGGPYRQTSYGYHPYHSYGIYDSILELLQKDGVVVFKLDYIGSLGLGRNYSEKIKTSVGKGDVEDIMESIAYVKNRYNIDNVYLAGNSYGGYMSLRALAEHPDSFTGVLSINGVTDWESLLNKMKTSIFNTQFNGLPNENNKDLYYQASIAERINNIGNQKIEIIAGEADRTIPLWQATTMYDKLKESGKNVTIVTYPNEDHVYKGKKTIEDLCAQLFSFVGLPVDKECRN